MVLQVHAASPNWWNLHHEHTLLESVTIYTKVQGEAYPANCASILRPQVFLTITTYSVMLF